MKIKSGWQRSLLLLIYHYKHSTTEGNTLLANQKKKQSIQFLYECKVTPFLIQNNFFIALNPRKVRTPKNSESNKFLALDIFKSNYCH